MKRRRLSKFEKSVLESNDRVNAFLHQRLMRTKWLSEKLEKATADYHFANGYRAGLDCALRAVMDGEDILGQSIDGLSPVTNE